MLKKRTKVLIIEDDLMIAEMTEEILVAHGYEVCGIATGVDQGVAMGKLHAPDIALIDYRLDDGRFGTEAGARLRDFGKLGILYVTGNNTQVVMRNAVGDACLVKPFRSAELLQSLEIVAGIVATGSAQPPFPRGFQVLSTITPPHEAAHDD